MDCANASFSRALVCPACDSVIPSTDDIICLSLNPTEEFKSTILAGMHPDIILDICQRALRFWTYQVEQEAFVQSSLMKKVESRYAQIEQQLQTAMHRTHVEVGKWKQKVHELQKSLDQERQRNQELGSQYTDKQRQLQKLQGSYEKLKRRMLSSPSPQRAPSDEGESKTIAFSHQFSRPGSRFGVVFGR